MQTLANVHETKWTPHVKQESDVAVHIIAVLDVFCRSLSLTQILVFCLSRYTMLNILSSIC